MSRTEIHRALYGKGRSKIGPEAAQQLAVVGWLSTALRLTVHRRNTGGATYQSNRKKYYVKFNRKGMSDLWTILADGCHLEIEMKAPGEVPTKEQSDWLMETIQRGGEAFWCSSLDACIESMREIYRRRGLAWPVHSTI